MAKSKDETPAGPPASSYGPAPATLEERQARIEADREAVRRRAARVEEAVRRANAGEPPLGDDEEL
jgi:hypothetical protein